MHDDTSRHGELFPHFPFLHLPPFFLFFLFFIFKGMFGQLDNWLDFDISLIKKESFYFGIILIHFKTEGDQPPPYKIFYFLFFI